LSPELNRFVDGSALTWISADEAPEGELALVAGVAVDPD